VQHAAAAVQIAVLCLLETNPGPVVQTYTTAGSQQARVYSAWKQSSHKLFPI